MVPAPRGRQARSGGGRGRVGRLQARGLHPLAVEAMREVGIDISHHTSKALADLPSLKGYDDVFTVCAQAEEACPVFPGKTTRLFWPHVDPATATGSEPEKLETLRRVRDLIGERARGFLAGLAG